MYRLIDPPTDGDSRPSNPSTRRYMPSSPAMPDDDTDDDETYTPIPARRRATVTTDHALQAVPQGSQYLSDDEYEVVQRGQRPQPQRDRRVTTVPSRLDQPVDRRGALAKLAGAGLATLAAGAVLGTWPVSEGAKLETQFQQGLDRSLTMELVCGHHDSDANKTLLHLTFMADRLIMLEFPGGDASKFALSVSDTLASHGIYADHEDISLMAAKVPVDNGKVEIHTTVRWQPVGVLAKSLDTNFIFIDAGGFFRSPTKAPIKK